MGARGGSSQPLFRMLSSAPHPTVQTSLIVRETDVVITCVSQLVTCMRGFLTCDSLSRVCPGLFHVHDSLSHMCCFFHTCDSLSHVFPWSRICNTHLWGVPPALGYLAGERGIMKCTIMKDHYSTRYLSYNPSPSPQSIALM